MLKISTRIEIEIDAALILRIIVVALLLLA